jgi:hypothetical protein
VRLPSVVTLALLAGLLGAPVVVASEAQAAECPATMPYPGDTAPKAAIAAWMATGAAARGIPGELPVMAALVESELVNLKSGSADAKGYFQMRESIWSGTYPGFPDNPELQLDWFLDQAVKVRTPPYPDETKWGEWAADVERPAAKFRGRYQLRLGDARLLIGPACTPPDTVVPLTEVRAPARQNALKGQGVRVSVSCPAEQCTVDVRGRVLLGKRPRLTAPPATLAPGQHAMFRLHLRPGVRRLVAWSLEHHQRVPVRLTVTTTDASGNATVSKTTVRITG